MPSRPRPAAPRPRLRPDDRGVGLISTFAGILVFLAFLFFAVQLLFNLFATSAVTSAGYDAARRVATSGVDISDRSRLQAEERAAEARARDILGRYGRTVSFVWDVDAARVRLRLQVENPHLLFGGLSGGLPFTHVDRTVTVRVEQLR